MAAIKVIPHSNAYLFYPSHLKGLYWDTLSFEPMIYIDKAKQSAEPCEEHEAQFYSIFLHLTKGGEGRECIADCSTKAAAEQLIAFLNTFHEHTHMDSDKLFS